MANIDEAVYFNPWDENFRANPYIHYKPLLSGPPRVLDVGIPMALVARYNDAVSVLHNHNCFSSAPPRTPIFEQRIKIFGEGARVLFSDPPVHTRLRRLVTPAFAPRRIRDLEPRIRAIAAELLDNAAARGEFDVMADLANPLPVMVIAEMLGVPPQDYPTFKRWSDLAVEADNIPPGSELPPLIRQSVTALRAYFAGEIEKRRRTPGDDLISLLVTAQEADALSADELLVFVVLLLLAGNETTTNLIGNGMLALGRNPQQLARLRRDPALMPGAIEEMLRYDAPAQSTIRHPKADTEVGGITLRPGVIVFVVVAAANRDPAQFPDADRFDITRDPNHHLAFGEGIHYCLGASLARLEASIAIGAALERFPRLRLADPDAALKYKGSYFLRGLNSLPMAIG